MKKSNPLLVSFVSALVACTAGLTGAMDLGTNLEQTGLVTFTSPGNRVWVQSVYDTDGAVFATIQDPWNPNFIEDIRYYKVLRFMDWGRTNPSVLDNWANRRHKTDLQNCDWSEDLGIAYEWWIHLANKTQKDMWINVPHLMCDRTGFEEGTNDFCRRWAILLKHGVDTGTINLDALGNLETMTRQDFINAGGTATCDPVDADLKIFIEFDNETWLGNYDYMQAEGLALGFSSGEAAAKFHAWAAARMFAYFEEVFGVDSPRLVKVDAHQVGPGAWSLGKHMEVFRNATLNPSGTLPDAFTIACYIGAPVNGNDADAIDQIRTDMYNTREDNWIDFRDAVDAAKITDGRDYLCIAYEGGQHVSTGSSVVSADPDMYDLYTEWLSVVEQYFDLVCHFNNCGDWGDMAWGAQKYTTADPTEPSAPATWEGTYNAFPKYKALMDYAIPDGYYVATDGSDSNPGTFEEPWATIQHACDTVVAGDTVFIRGGVYNISTPVMPQNSGTASDWITYQGFPGETPILDGTTLVGDAVFQLEDNDYILIDNLHVRNSTGQGISVYISDYVTVQNCSVSNTWSCGIGLWGDKLQQIWSSNIRAISNLVYKPNSWDAPGADLGATQPPHESITIGRVDDFEVAWNEVLLGNKEGIDAKGPNRRGTIHNNFIHQKERTAIYVDGWSALMEDIEIYENVITGCQFGITIASEEGTPVDNIRVHHNLIDDCTKSGIFVSQAGVDGMKTNLEFINNTVTKCEYGVLIFSPLVDYVTIRNNICYDNDWQEIRIDPDPVATHITSDYNLTASDPLWVSPANGNFHLQASSPAIDNGHPDPVYYDPDGTRNDQGAFYYAQSFVTNNPPEFTSDPIVKPGATANAPYAGSIAGDATDADVDPLTFYKLSGPAWLSVATNGTLSGTPTLANQGVNNFGVQVIDGKGGSDTATLQIQVIPFELTTEITVCDAGGTTAGTPGSGASSASFTATNTGPAGDYLVVAAVSETADVQGMTFGGVAMTPLLEEQSTPGKVEFFGLATSALNGTVNVTYHNGNIYDTQTYGWAFLKGVDTANPLRTALAIAQDSGTGAITLNYPVSPAAGDFALLAGYKNNDRTIAMTPQDVILRYGYSGSTFTGYVAYDAALGAGAYSSAFTFTLDTAREVVGGVILKAAAGDPNGDTDGDGIPDWYEGLYSGSVTGLVATLDGDGDGPDAYAEWMAMTDPTDSNSYFHVSSVLPIAGGVVLEWPSSTGRVYDIEWQDNLVDPMDPLAADLPATPPVNTYTDTTHGAESGGFYGVSVGMAP